MKTIYLSDQPLRAYAVYGGETAVLGKADVMNAPADFADTEYIFSTWGMPAFTEEEIATVFPSLKAIFYAAGSVRHFAAPFLNSGVKVFSAWAANAVPVAEYTVAQIVLANKGFFKTMRYTDRDRAKETTALFDGNYGVKIGILGAGMIGKLVIRMLKAYAVDVLVFDPFLSDDTAVELGVTKTSLEVVFRECQVVSNHLANNEQTEDMLNKPLFESMLPNATFLNTGRGAQVVEDDLIAVLKTRSDLTAVLDVTEPEPPSADSELYTLDNCILTPHIAGSIGNEVKRMAQYMREEYDRFVNNEPCRYEVTLDMLKTMA